MGIAIPDEIGVRRHFSTTAKQEEIEFILRLTERLPMFFKPVLDDYKNGAPAEDVERQMEAVLSNLIEISQLIGVVMPIPDANKH